MKFQLVCKKCGKVIGDFATWFSQNQKCVCGSNYAEVRYNSPKKMTKVGLNTSSDNFQDFYFDYLPIEDKDNIVSFGEGMIPIERWPHLEDAARENGVQCEVYVYRNDKNGASGTFKDISAALAATVLKENDVKTYCLASTGNAAVSFATYLAKANIKCNVFFPSFADSDSVHATDKVGQNVVIAHGGYGDAKKMAADFHADNNVLITGGNTDPIRIESKRTMVFECIRQMGTLPTVYLQSVAGGTSPLAFEKGYRDLQEIYHDEKYEFPRMILVQQDTCDPMVTSWENAVAQQFPEGWENDYVVKDNVSTRIGILTAANPGNYPLVAPLVRNSGGAFVRVVESELPVYGKNMLDKAGVLMGPASVVCYAGFFESLKKGLIRNGDKVLLNTGEGCGRATWFKHEVEKLTNR